MFSSADSNIFIFKDTTDLWLEQSEFFSKIMLYWENNFIYILLSKKGYRKATAINETDTFKSFKRSQ